jgi:hypothetical protein
MKVTKSAVYRLTVEGDCGCTVAQEFSDVELKQSLAKPVFNPCEKHEPAKDMLETIFLEMHAKEVDEEAKRVETETARINEAKKAIAPSPRPVATTPADPNAPQRIEIPIPGVGPVVPKVVTAADVVLTENDVEPLPETRSRAASARPAARPAGGAGGQRPAGGFRRSAQPTSAAEAVAARAGALPVIKVAGGGASSLNIDAAEEDPRVTNLIESAGFLDAEDDA